MDEFMKQAFIAVFSAGVCAGLIGPLILFRRMMTVAGGISHSLLGVVGLSSLLGIVSPYFLPVGAVVISVVIWFLEKNMGEQKTDVAVSLLWSLGMAVGIVLLNRSSNVATATDYLFGDVLIVGKDDLMLMWLIIAVIGLCYLFLYDLIVLVCVDRDFAVAQGVNVRLIELLILILVSLSVVALVKVLGIILMIAMLSVPSYVVAHRISGSKRILLGSVVLSCIVGLLGLGLSFWWDIPVSAGVVFWLVILYLLVVR